MKKLLIYIITIALIINFNYVTGKLKGEGATLNEDLFLMTCTVKNRLDKGWNPEKVMNAYIAPYITPSEEEIAFVKDVIENGDCPPVYFFYSEWAVKDKSEQPIFKSYGNWYYAYEQYKLLWKE